MMAAQFSSTQSRGFVVGSEGGLDAGRALLGGGFAGKEVGELRPPHRLPVPKFLFTGFRNAS